MSRSRSIPEELINIKAHEIWKKRQREGRDGTPGSDWEEARKYLEKHQWKVFWWEVRNPGSREFALEILKTLGIGLTAFGLLFSVWEGLEDRRLTQERLVTERFSKAVEQLGKNKTSVRIGGIYALERIAKDKNYQKDYYWTIMEVLTSYVHDLSPIPRELKKLLYKGEWGQRREELEKEKVEGVSIDIDVQTVLTVIGRREDPQPNIIELIFTNLVEQGKEPKIDRDERIDLSHTILNGAALENTNLEGVILFHTYLQGAFLNGAVLKGANLEWANLQDAFLSGANLQGANLQGANLIEANLIEANFSGANLEWANLQDAVLNRANLSGANLEWANLSGANLNRANLSGANLTQTIGLTFEQIKSACFWKEGIYEGEWDWNKETKTWAAKNEPAKQKNTNYIEGLEKDTASNPKKKLDCSRW